MRVKEKEGKRERYEACIGCCDSLQQSPRSSARSFFFIPPFLFTQPKSTNVLDASTRRRWPKNLAKGKVRRGYAAGQLERFFFPIPLSFFSDCSFFAYTRFISFCRLSRWRKTSISKISGVQRRLRARTLGRPNSFTSKTTRSTPFFISAVVLCSCRCVDRILRSKTETTRSRDRWSSHKSEFCEIESSVKQRSMRVCIRVPKVFNNTSCLKSLFEAFELTIKSVVFSSPTSTPKNNPCFFPCFRERWLLSMKI